MARKAEVRYINFYNVGSSAYKLDTMPTPKKQAKPLPKQRKAQKILLRVDPIAVGGVLIACVMMILMVVGLFQLSSAKKQAVQMQTYVLKLEAENKALDTQYRAGFDPEEVRQIATQMGMVPAEQAQQIQITVPVTEPVQEPTVWDRVHTFLVGLFA